MSWGAAMFMCQTKIENLWLEKKQIVHSDIIF